MTIPELEELVDLVLRRHHDVEARMLEELEARLQSSSLDQRIVAPFTHLFNELLSHMEKEETVLFPALRQLAAGEAVDVSCPLQAMEREHDKRGASLSSMTAQQQHSCRPKQGHCDLRQVASDNIYI